MSAGRINATVTDRRCIGGSFGVVRLDTVTFQLRAKLSEMLVISRLDRTEDVNGRNVGTGERAIVYDLFDARASRRDLGREIGKATGPITNDGGKSAKPAISDQT